jgi:hypothetical protein
MPTDMNVINGGHVFTTDGNFNSFRCVQAFINKNHHKDNTYNNKTNMLRSLYKIIYKKSIGFIEPADSPYDKLEKFCGPGGMTDEQYISEMADQ